MSSWYYKSLGDAMIASQTSDEISKAFLSSYQSAGHPIDMAIFTRSDSVDRLHCEISVYFSPAASGLAEEFDALPCETPLKAGLELLAGNEQAWSVLFPENHK